MDHEPTQARLCLGDRPRVEIPLAATSAGLPAWVTVCLPAPTAEPRPEGRLVADPRIPESEIILAWGRLPAVPRPLHILTVRFGDQSWTLEQDHRDPERWRLNAEHDGHRAWS